MAEKKQSRADKQRGNSATKRRGKPFEKANPHAFKPGESGNPQGRPKRTKLSEALIAKMAEAMPAAEESTVAERVAEALICAALQGNVQAIREIGDRCEGRPRQMIEVDATLRDWRALSQANGVTEAEVLLEATKIIESYTAASNAESD